MAVADFSASPDKCAIVGIGRTDYSTKSGRSELTLATAAAAAALADAGLTAADVDGIVRCDMDVVSHMALASSLGAKDITFWADAGPGGCAPAAMVAQGVAAIVAGLATTVVAFRSLNGRSGRRFAAGAGALASAEIGGQSSYDEMFVPYGLLAPGQVFAMMARKHMIDYGTRQEALGEIAVSSRSYAQKTPHAQMRDRPLTMDDYMRSRMISDPLHVNDYCLETDGACAVVITSAERAKDLRQPAGLIRAASAAYASDIRPGICFPSLMRDDIRELPGRRVAANLWSRAGMGPEEVDVAQMYDCFSIAVLLQVEEYGFCKRGESGAFIESGALRPEGAIPVNTAGGNMSEGYIHGMSHVYEGVRQVRGEADVQIADVETCLVTGGPLPVSSALLLTGGVMEAALIMPRTDDPDTSGFFAAARDNKLVVKKCLDCGHCLNPPRAYCDACGGWTTDWAEVRPRGTLVSWTVVTHSVHPAYPAPYTLVLVEVADEPELKLIGSVAGAPPLEPGMAMKAWFQPVGDAVLPQWRPKT